MSDTLGVPNSKLTRGVKSAKGQHGHDSQISETALETTNEGFVVWDAKLKLVAWSKKCPDFWYEPESILRPGMPMVELLQHIATNGGFGPGDPDKLAQRELRRIRKAGKVSEDEFEMRDGRVIHVQRSAMPDGGHSSTYTDISARRRAEVALRESKERYETLFHQSPLGITMEDYSGVKLHIDRLRAEGVDDFLTYFRDNGDAIAIAVDNVRLIDANDTMIQMFGTSSFDEYEKYENDYILAEGDIWREFYINELAAFASGDVTYTGETSDIMPDGTPIEVRCASRIVESSTDNWSQVISTHEDITERKQARMELEESEARYQEIFDEAPITLWVEDWSRVKQMIDRLSKEGVENWEAYFADHRDRLVEMYDLAQVVETSRMTLDLYGAENIEDVAAASTGEDVLREEIDAFAKILFDIVEGGWKFDIESLDTKVDGTEIFVHTRGIIPPSHRHDWSRVIYSIEDITDQKKARDSLRTALADAEQANRAKSEFLATMSHEFRTPLNAILGFSEMIHGKYYGPSGSGNYEEYAGDIHDSGKHMLALVNDMLDIAAIEAGKRAIAKEAVDVEEVLRGCINDVEHAAKNAGIILSLEVPDDLPSLYADKRSITQVTLNLLSNAIKFTERDGTVLVSVSTSHHEMTIRVSDTGIGIAPDRLSKITEPFSQAHDNSYLTQNGTGLGLSIVKSLAEMHEGKLNIESEIGKGTTVIVGLPARPPAIIS